MLYLNHLLYVRQATNHMDYQTLLAGFGAIPFNRMLGLSLEELNPQSATMRFSMKDELIGNYLHGILHGGVISSVLDMAGGMVVMANAVSKHPEYSHEELAKLIGKCSTIDLHVSYLQPGKGESFLAKAWLIRSGKQISFTRMELYNEAHLLISSASGTYRL